MTDVDERLAAAVEAGEKAYKAEFLRADAAWIHAAKAKDMAQKARARAIIASILEPDGSDHGLEAALADGGASHRGALAGRREYRDWIRQRAGLPLTPPA